MRVLLVEDETRLANAVRRGLEAEGFSVDVAADGKDGFWRASEGRYDAIVLDIMLPGMNGFKVCSALREAGHWTPILMLTAKDGELDEAEALDTGADDFLTKPFSFVVLTARLRALLRRRPARGSAYLVVADLRLNPDSREVFRGDRRVDLTAREFELLEYLMRNERLVVSRQALLDEVWGYHPFAETNTVDVFVSNLRRKLEEGGERRLLHTVRGAGYVLREP
jgi:DNA-binding response OmpR family regulator